jgi:prephenate dehydratase
VMGPREPNKTTVVFTLPNTPGSLFKALSVFALREIDVTKVESRPIPGRPWEYMFYLDVAAGSQEFRAARALMHLAEFAPTLKTLGSYPSVASPIGRSTIAPPLPGTTTTNAGDNAGKAAAQ